MARIRSVKPTFFTDEDMAALPDDTHRLAYIGLWTYVDDYGRGRDDARLIKAALFMLDDRKSIKGVDKIVTALAKAGRLVRYTGEDGRQYLAVRNWHHQKISHPTASIYPSPDDPGSVILPNDSRTAPETSPNGSGPRVRPLIGSKEGSKEQGKGPGVPAVPDPAQDLLRSFYDSSDPKPAQPWPAMLQVVRKMLSAGWMAEDVAWALRDAPAVSTAALTFSLNRRNGNGGSSTIAGRSEEAMLSWLEAQEAQA